MATKRIRVASHAELESSRPMIEDISLTDRLNRWSFDREGPWSDVFAMVYKRLHGIAKRKIAERGRDPILQTTVLVNEAYLRLARLPRVRWNDREHFYAYCARVMRAVLVDLAKERRRQKRGSGAIHVSLEDAPAAAESPPSEDVLAVNQALTELAELDPERARIVELRYFGGMEPRAIGRVLGISESTVHRRWRLARAWLYHRLSDPS